MVLTVMVRMIFVVSLCFPPGTRRCLTVQEESGKFYVLILFVLFGVGRENNDDICVKVIVEPECLMNLFFSPGSCKPNLRGI